MKSFDVQVNDYAATLSSFVREYDLPAEWFAVPDHVAVKGADKADFEALVEQFRPLSERISCIDMDNRRLATAQLTGDILVGAFGAVQWVEIMEPRPEKVGKDVVGFEHMEFYYPHFDRVIDVLNQKGIAYEMQKNPGHAWANIVLNEKGQELKLNDKPLGTTVFEELEDGRSYIL
jgi:hypothetical protein